jgi:hypothetical protein
MNLLDLQRKTLQAVSRPLTHDYRMRARIDGARSMYEEAGSFIRPNDRLSSFERLEIYNRQYWFRLVSALTEDFPGLVSLLGDKAFERLTIDYLVANPSRSFTLRNLGHNFAEWLTTYTKPLPVQRELLLDVARLEWAHIEAFDNGEFTPLSVERIAQVAESSHLRLQPHVRLLTLGYPVDNFVVAVHRNQDEPSMASNAVSRPTLQRKRRLANLRPERLCLVVHRYQEFVYYKRLEPDAYRVLKRIDGGNMLADALEKAFKESEDSEFLDKIPKWFTNWGELGWLGEGDSADQAGKRSSHPQ